MRVSLALWQGMVDARTTENDFSVVKSMAKHKKGRKKRHISPARKAAFMRGRKAALSAGWKPFTKMSKTQKAAFRKAYHKA
jgi:hypothetical protein